MFRKRFYYIIELQYLGFRYHGWQKQPEVNTVERMVSRTLAYVLERKNFKLLASGRTDAKVSASMALVELYLEETPLELASFLPLFNQNLPPDIRAMDIYEVDEKFNIIDAPKSKEYHYLFSFGPKTHPFSAPFLCNKLHDLDISEMKKAAILFQGNHDFWSYAYKPTAGTQTNGEIEICEIVENTMLTASFFPEHTFMLRVKGKGFKRHQIRLMMGALFDVGEGKVNIDFIRQTLDASNKIKLEHVAQASGLLLHKIDYDKD